MRTRSGKESPESRGATAWNDGVHSVDGGSTFTVSGSVTPPEDPGAGSGETIGNGNDVVEEASGTGVVKSWTDFFKPIEEDESGCKDGVCPVPWLKNNTDESAIASAPVIQEDTVNHPSHYNDGEIECIEAIESALTNEEFRGYCKANCIKYIWRERHKGGTESLKKAQWYLDLLVQVDEFQNG